MRAVKGSLGHSLQERHEKSGGPRWTRAVGMNIGRYSWEGVCQGRIRNQEGFDGRSGTNKGGLTQGGVLKIIWLGLYENANTALPTKVELQESGELREYLQHGTCTSGL